VKVALGITGCIAAYKAIEVMRGLQKAGVSVQVILTRSGAEFVTPLTFESLSAQDVITDMFQPGQNRDIHHISVAQSIQLLAIVPATANILGKFAHGIADDFLSTLYLSTPAPVLLAPAMNVEMWRHPAVRANVEILNARGHCFVNPEPGPLACGMEGEGRLAAVEVIVNRILEALRGGESLAGLKVLVTAGPTVEDIDPIRFLSNRSSGKMGYAVAEAAVRRGATVFLVSGPTELNAPSGVQRIQVRSAEQMKNAVIRLYPEMDIVIKAAAVADYRPVEPAPQKIKKNKEAMVLCLARTEDILEILGKKKKGQVLVGFAAETEHLLDFARKKLIQKNPHPES
jgi:phosphopantothenoylcysteine decarboxylase/phosphopantothenate--cysteine ligase